VLINILNEIYGEIYSHFALEEKLMEKNGYDAYKEHKADHDRLLDDIRDITTELEKTAEYDEQVLKKKLADWFSVHFKTHDSRLHKLEELIASQEASSGGLMSSLKKALGKNKK
jgi:hemerythrin-like metal-binding protein